MASITIDLECPKCDALLALDAGFAGGVCRCARCGTLMTVPGTPGEQPERLERPEAPPAPLSPKGLGGARGRAEQPTADPTPGEQRYRTASGRIVTVREPARIPLAPLKRKAVRAATVVMFLVVVGGLLALCVTAAMMLLSEPTAEQVAAATHVEVFTHDPRVNPLTLEAPNLFGLPLANRVAVVYDATALGAAERDAVNALLLDGLERDAPAVRVSLFLALPDGRVEARLTRQTLGGATLPEVAERLRRLDASTDPRAMLGAVERAAAEEPEVLILVTARSVEGREADAIRAMTRGTPVRIDAVLLDADSFGLEDLTRATHGHYVPLEREDEIASWLENAGP